MIRALLSLVLTGLIVGALGRLAIPGPNPMSIGMTILVGIGGALLGTLVGLALGASVGLLIILQILGAALIVYLMQRRSVRTTY